MTEAVRKETVSATVEHRRALKITFALTLTYFVVEVVGGILTNSLALLADAAHMLTDVGGLGLADEIASGEAQAILETLSARLKEEFSIDHTTLQLEHASLAGSETRL